MAAPPTPDQALAESAWLIVCVVLGLAMSDAVGRLMTLSDREVHHAIPVAFA